MHDLVLITLAFWSVHKELVIEPPTVLCGTIKFMLVNCKIDIKLLYNLTIIVILIAYNFISIFRTWDLRTSPSKEVQKYSGVVNKCEYNCE